MDDGFVREVRVIQDPKHIGFEGLTEYDKEGGVDGRTVIRKGTIIPPEAVYVPAAVGVKTAQGALLSNVFGTKRLG
jgi:hypothetical protein